MTRPNDIAAALEKHLPPELLVLLRQVGEAAARQGCPVFLVGGVVRDLLLGRRSLDMDLVVEGDAIKLARRLARDMEGQAVAHPSFGTAKLKLGRWSLDLAAARRETYSQPGALPTVEPGAMEEDLFRRDFTINAMALDLRPDRYGHILDPYGGGQDLEQRLVRVLHEGSFADDATRIFRAIRYEQRLGFRIEQVTAGWLKRDLGMINTVSGDRVRHELELMLREDRPERMLRRAGELGVLAAVEPSLTADDWLSARFEAARSSANKAQTHALYWCLLFYRLPAEAARRLMERLNFARALGRAVEATLELRDKLADLARPGLKPSDVYALLHKYPVEAVQANAIAQGPGLAQDRLRLYIEGLRCVRTSLDGGDLQRMGVPPGPRLGRLLAALHRARLDGEATSKDDEVALVQGWLKAGREDT